jgi:hypothetical protein
VKRIRVDPFISYALATAIWVVGIQFAAARFPGGAFEWTHTVISALASRKHNPEGAAWFAGAIAGAMLLLWPIVTALTRGKDGRLAPRWVEVALRVGVACGLFVGIERLVFYHFSTLVRKGHEIVALVAFLSFYLGILGLYTHRVRTRRAFLWPALVVVTPLVAVGLRELMLYLAQRGVGWADYDWRGAGTPWWLSFAWWQWLGAVLLWLAVGHLLVASRGTDLTEGNGENRGRF